jgi:YgiT-type zinc finger domain-containing protein
MSDTCPNCHLGHLKAMQTVFVQIYGDTLVHAPNVPAWKCDVCGETYFAPENLRRLDILIGHSGPPPNRHIVPAPDTPPVDPDTPASVPLRPPTK